MTWWQSIILGIVEGITEFLPISSTGHLTVVEKLMGLNIADTGVTAYTAVIQVGAILAAIVYFFKDIVRLAVAWFKGLTNAEARRNVDYRLGWGVIVGVIPAVIAGLALRKVIEGPFRSLWVVAGAFIAWSLVLLAADRLGKQRRTERDVTIVDALIMGLFQCIALIPGVSRSGATIAGGLFRGIDRVAATRWSFFLGIPTLLGAGAFEAAHAAKDIGSSVGWVQTGIGTVVSFVVAYAAIAWLLRFVAHNRFTGFVVYRVIAGLLIIGLLIGRVVSAT